MSYEVVRGFMNQFLLGRLVSLCLCMDQMFYWHMLLQTCRTTIYTQYCVLVKAHEEAGNQHMKKTFTYNHYRFSWYAFLDLLNMDLKQGFMCSHCECQPEIVIMDATSLSFRKEFIPWKLEAKSEKDKINKSGR